MSETLTGELEPQGEVTLPSDVVIEPTIDDFISSNTSENGKLFGQFDNVTQALEHYRKQEITHTNNMRELKNAEKSKQNEVQSVQAELETTQAQEAIVSELLPEFINNNMKLTDEMVEKIKATGLDEKDIRLKAYEVRENAEAMKAKAYAITGNGEEYSAMIAWSQDKLSDADKSNFDKAIQGLNGDSAIGALAIEGLYNRYKNRDNQSNEPIQQTRVQGESPKIAPTGGYTNFNDLSRDRQASQKNPALREQYLKKLSMTDDRVLSLR
jgi:hypothetical protein